MQPREVRDLVEQAHLRVQAALLGHVAEAQPVGIADRVPVPRDRAAVGAQDAHHRRASSSSCRRRCADEPDDLARADREARRRRARPGRQSADAGRRPRARLPS